MAVLTPARPAYDPADLLLTDIEFGSEFGLLDAALFVSSPDLVDLSLAELSHAVTCPTVVGNDKPVTTLFHCILHVVLTCAQEPVGIVLARWVVAGVTYIEAIWNRANSLYVSPSRGHHDSALAVNASDAELAVLARSSHCSSPWPALARTTDLDLVPVSSQTLFRGVGSTHTMNISDALAMNEEDDYTWMA